jgi:hypothetical protein
VRECLVVPRRHVQLGDLTAGEVESATSASRAVVGALRGEGVKGAKLNQVGPASGFAHYSILIGAEHGGVDEIDDFVNRLRPHL